MDGAEHPWLENSLEARLSGVSCSATSACTAVGWYDNATEKGDRALVERYNGTSWQLQESPSPVGKPAPEESHWELTAVSCPTSSSCVAVGSYDESRSGQTHRWARNGTAVAGNSRYRSTAQARGFYLTNPAPYRARPR